MLSASLICHKNVYHEKIQIHTTMNVSWLFLLQIWKLCPQCQFVLIVHARCSRAKDGLGDLAQWTHVAQSISVLNKVKSWPIDASKSCPELSTELSTELSWVAQSYDNPNKKQGWESTNRYILRVTQSYPELPWVIQSHSRVTKSHAELSRTALRY